VGAGVPGSAAGGEGGEEAVELARFLRLAEIWAIIMIGSGLGLVAAVIQPVWSQQVQRGGFAVLMGVRRPLGKEGGALIVSVIADLAGAARTSDAAPASGVG
jgi:hypothetical protein